MIKNSKRKLILIMMAVWGCAIGTSFICHELDNREEERRLEMNTAKAFFQQVVISRLWNASHGGVYVPVTAETQPNPYLLLQGRELTADNGLKLTRINPSSMTRQIAELSGKNEGGIQFHLTSLKPIRPENKATEWEERWLNFFEQGDKEQGEFFDDGDITRFRYMAPILARPECLKCHGRQGYKEGDNLGGLSISLPYLPHTHTRLIAGYGSMAVVGLILIFVGITFYERKRLLFDAIFNNAIPTCVVDKNHTILMANESYWEEFGPLPDHRKTIKCHKHRPGESCLTEHCLLTMIMREPCKHTFETHKDKAGTPCYLLVTVKPLVNANGKVIGMIESFQDISKRKLAQKALEESNRKLEALSNTDGLTGIANRRHFNEVLTREYARHARSEAELSLILLDIDLFKSFNDCYGHVAGDECLQQVAQVIAGCLARPADLAARYGGEEFVCILPDTDSNGAVAIAEKIRQEIMARAIPHKESTVANCITASLGVATVPCTVGGSIMDIVARVDQQLYRAKSSGRNRVEFVAPHEVGGVIKSNFVRLAWKDSFCCGNRLLDSQHQTLFLLSNELLDAVLSTRPATEVAALSTRLFDNIRQHIHDEEAVLKAAEIPGLSQHMAEHGQLLAKGLELTRQLNVSMHTVSDVFQLLANEVVLLYMLESDQNYFQLICKAGAADSIKC